jgi:WD40 repeat protein
LEGGQLNTWVLTNRAPTLALAVLHGHEQVVGAVAFWQSSNSVKLISASWDKTVRLWEPAVAKCEEIVLPMRASALAVAISPDGSYLATVVPALVAPGEKTARSPFELQLWDFKTRLFLKAVPFGGQNPSPWIDFSPDSKLLAVTDYSPLQFYKVPSLEFVKTAGSRGPVFATNGSWLAYIGNKGIIKRASLDALEQVLVPGGPTSSNWRFRRMAASWPAQNSPARKSGSGIRATGTHSDRHYPATPSASSPSRSRRMAEPS